MYITFWVKNITKFFNTPEMLTVVFDESTSQKPDDTTDENVRTLF